MIPTQFPSVVEVCICVCSGIWRQVVVFFVARVAPRCILELFALDFLPTSYSVNNFRIGWKVRSFSWGLPIGRNNLLYFLFCIIHTNNQLYFLFCIIHTNNLLFFLFCIIHTNNLLYFLFCIIHTNNLLYFLFCIIHTNNLLYFLFCIIHTNNLLFFLFCIIHTNNLLYFLFCIIHTNNLLYFLFCIIHTNNLLYFLFCIIHTNNLLYFLFCIIHTNNLLYFLFCIIHTGNGQSLDFHRTTGSYRKENTKSPFVFPARYERLCLTQSSSVDASLGFHRAFVFYHTESTNHWLFPKRWLHMLRIQKDCMSSPCDGWNSN